jgi:hypothetical protein
LKANRIAIVDFDHAMVGAVAVGCVLVNVRTTSGSPPHDARESEREIR